MTSFHITMLSGYTIVFAAVIGLVRYGRMVPSYQPFSVFAWVNLLNHSISLVSVWLFKTNAVNGNIYVLAEGLLLLWLFYRWGVFYKKRGLLVCLLVLFSASWVVDNFVLHKITQINSPYRIIYSFTLVFLSISQINRTIAEERRSLIRNAQFLICVGFVIYYTYKATVEVFFLFELPTSVEFLNNIFLIFVYINLFVNFLYAIAAAWIPTKQKFILRY